MSRFVDRQLGSPGIYARKGREAAQSVNFVTCHDGFTLNDLVSYDEKHNAENGEGNRDGTDDNRSWNCGVEGETDDPNIDKLRNRQVKNLLTATLISLGTPMILMGDEVRRTQRGNNNAYCQDNAISWFDWSLLEKHADVHRFVALLASQRAQWPPDAEFNRRKSLSQLLASAKMTWHGVKLNEPDWSPSSHSIAVSADIAEESLILHLIFNAYWKDLDFELPMLDDHYEPVWRRWIDTGLDSPDDIVCWDCAPAVTGLSYRAVSRSIVILVARSISVTHASSFKVARLTITCRLAKNAPGYAGPLSTADAAR